MNISRIALLTVLFSAPIFSMDAPATQTSFLTTAKNATMTVVNAPFVGARDLADFIADKSYLNTLIGKVTSYNPKVISRTLLAAATAALLYKAYTMYTAEEAAEANEDFFAEDTN